MKKEYDNPRAALKLYQAVFQNAHFDLNLYGYRPKGMSDSVHNHAMWSMFRDENNIELFALVCGWLDQFKNISRFLDGAKSADEWASKASRELGENIPAGIFIAACRASGIQCPARIDAGKSNCKIFAVYK